MYEIFGIAAVLCSVLIEELSNVLQDVAYLDKRHISVLVDRMVGTGKLLSVNMRGMDGYENASQVKASLKELLKNLQRSCYVAQ